MATRPATRCKAADYIQIVAVPCIYATLAGDIAVMALTWTHRLEHGMGIFRIHIQLQSFCTAVGRNA